MCPTMIIYKEECFHTGVGLLIQEILIGIKFDGLTRRFTQISLMGSKQHHRNLEGH